MVTDAGRVPEGTGLSSSMEPASGLHPSGFDPSRITAHLRLVSGSVLEPIIKDASERFYEAALSSAEDYLRDNLDWNISSHISMLERENQRMRTELYEVDRMLSAPSQSHADRLHGIALLDLGKRQHSELLYQVSRKFEGETRHQTALRYLRERDSDGSGEAGETGTGSTEGDSAGPQGIAQPSAPQSSGAHK